MGGVLVAFPVLPVAVGDHHPPAGGRVLPPGEGQGRGVAAGHGPARGGFQSVDRFRQRFSHSPRIPWLRRSFLNGF